MNNTEKKAAFEAPTSPADFPAGEYQINGIENGCEVAYVLLKDNRIARIKEGTGEDVERATLIAGENKSAYFTALMSGCVEIDGTPVIMEDLRKNSMKNYMRIQVAFSEINF